MNHRDSGATEATWDSTGKPLRFFVISVVEDRPRCLRILCWLACGRRTWRRIARRTRSYEGGAPGSSCSSRSEQVCGSSPDTEGQRGFSEEEVGQVRCGTPARSQPGRVIRTIDVPRHFAPITMAGIGDHDAVECRARWRGPTDAWNARRTSAAPTICPSTASPACVFRSSTTPRLFRLNARNGVQSAPRRRSADHSSIETDRLTAVPH